MGRTFTVDALITRAKQQSDFENSKAISDAEWKGYLATLYSELYELLVASGHRYFEAERTYVTDGGAVYDLPDDFLGLVGVDYVDGIHRRELDELMIQERNRITGFGAANATFFELVGNQIRFVPTPQAGQTYRMLYVPFPANLNEAALSDTIDVKVPAGEDFLIWGAAKMALAKEESDTSVATMNFERARMRLEEMREHRTIVNTRRHQVRQVEAPGPWDPAEWRPWRFGGGGW